MIILTHLQVEIFTRDVMQWIAMELELEDRSWTDLSINFYMT